MIIYFTCGGFLIDPQLHYGRAFVLQWYWTVVWILMDTPVIDFWTERVIDMRIVCINSKSIFEPYLFVIMSTFVDPRTGEHTNGIENCWSLMKKNLRRFYPIKNDTWLLMYLYSYQFRFNFLNHYSKLEMFEKIIDLMG